MTRHLTACIILGLIAAVCVAAWPARAADEESIGDIRDRINDTERKKLELVKTLALICEARGESDKAIAYTYQAFMLDAADEDLAGRLLELLRKGERWDEMVPIYKRLIDERPASSRQYLLELSQCLFRLEREDEALATLEQYRTEYADYEDTYLKLSAILSNHGHTQQAAEALEQALGRADLSKSYRLQWQLGVVYVDLGQTEKAIDAYERALDLVGPGSDRDAINNRLIELYKQAERIDEVIEKREQEIEDIDAKLVKMYWAEAEKREKNEEFGAAIEYYGKIVALAPDSDTGKAAAARIEQLKPKLEE